MKKSIFTILCATAFLFTINIATAQKFSDLDKSPMDQAAFPSSYKVADKAIKVVYSRPQLKERALSKLAPNGEVWRTGANEAPQITLYTPMMFGKTLVAPGTYSLFTIPGEKEWTIIINTATNVWGAYTYDKAQDVARITVPAVESKNTLESFSMVFEESKTGVDLYMGWGNVMVQVPFAKGDTAMIKK